MKHFKPYTGASPSLMARLVVGFVGLLVLTQAAVFVYLDRALQQELLAQDSRALADALTLVQHVLGEHRSFQELEDTSHRLLDAHGQGTSLSFLLQDTSGRVVASHKSMHWLSQYLPPPSMTGAAMAPAPRTVRRGPHAWRVLTAQGELGDAARTPIGIALALDLEEGEGFAARYRLRLAAAVLVAALVAAGVGVPLVRKGLRPLGAMAERAQAISAARLDERLPVQDAPRELRPLALAFNQMLGRLEESFHRLSQFSSDLAHDLRTPVGNLMGEAQVALSRPRSPEEYRAVLASALEEFERINRMIDGMLFIARAENAQPVLARRWLDASVEVTRIVDYCASLAEERGILLGHEGRASVYADPELFGRALSNLLLNAFDHTPSGGRIEVTVTGSSDAGVCVEVANSGPGIPADALPHIFDRFFRASAARERSGQGSGLGLAIVRSIMQLHGGSVAVRSDPGGQTVFTLRFPGAPEAL